MNTILKITVLAILLSVSLSFPGPLKESAIMYMVNFVDTVCSADVAPAIKEKIREENLKTLAFIKYGHDKKKYRFVYIYINCLDSYRNKTFYAVLYYQNPGEDDYNFLSVGFGELIATQLECAEDIIEVGD